MKRSTGLTLKRMRPVAALGVVGGGVAVWAFGSDGPVTEAVLFQTVEQCVQSGGAVDAADCRRMMRDALDEHEVKAPRYDEQSLCEEEFGPLGCEPAAAAEDEEDGDGRVWRPRFVGWALVDLMELVDDIDDPMKLPKGRHYGKSGAILVSQPFYRTLSREAPLRTLAGGALWKGEGGRYRAAVSAIVEAPARRPQVLTRTIVASRGGFAGAARFNSVGG